MIFVDAVTSFDEWFITTWKCHFCKYTNNKAKSYSTTRHLSSFLEIKNIQKRWDRFIIFFISTISTWNKMMFHILVFFILIDFFMWDLPKGMRKSHFESAFWFRLDFSFSHILFCWTWQNISNWSLFEHIFTCAFDLQPMILSEI